MGENIVEVVVVNVRVDFPLPLFQGVTEFWINRSSSGDVLRLVSQWKVYLVQG